MHFEMEFSYTTNNLLNLFYKIKNGTNALEMDLCLTKDEEVIVIHDHNLLRLCGVDEDVNKFNYKDLPKFSENVFLHFI